jgi:glycosyltransferase involved in cell wall biosynthesis
MSPIGVRMINIDFYPLLGGAQMHTLRLCRYLRVNGVDVEVITRHHPGLAIYEEIDGVPVYRTPILHKSRGGTSLSFTYYALKRIAASRAQVQIVHSHEMLSPMTIGLFSHTLFGTRLVINPHRGGYLGDMYKIQNRRRSTGKLRLAWARSGGDAFISVSNEISSELRGGGIAPEKIHFIPYVIDTNHFKPASEDQREDLRLQFQLTSHVTACYTGRLVPEKGLDLLLQAWAEVVKLEPSALLLIVGDGDQRDALVKQAAQLGLNQHVRFTGPVEDTTPYLQASDVYVQSSFTEGLPIAMLEAMACALPILATSVGGVPDIIHTGDNGIVIPPHDVDSLQKRLIELICDEKLRVQYGARARKKVVSYCAIEKIGQDHINLYQQLLEKNPIKSRRTR